jgi:hypothetical protein
MTVRIETALAGGVQRLFSLSGLVVFVLALCYQALFLSAINTLLTAVLAASPAAFERDPGLLALPVADGVAAALAVGAVLLGFAVFVVGARLFARPLGAMSSVPGRVFTRRALPAYLSMVVANLFIGVLATLGFALLIVPGLFVTVTFQFAVFAVALEDVGPVAALRRSWNLATGNRWRLFGLVVIIGLVSSGASVLLTALSFVLPGPTAVFQLCIYAAILVFTYSVLADAYLQVRNEAPDHENAAAPRSDVNPL